MSPCQGCGQLRLRCADVAVVWLIRPGVDGWAGVNAGRWLAFPLEWGIAQASDDARLGCWMRVISVPVAWPGDLGLRLFAMPWLRLRMEWNGPLPRQAVDPVWPYQPRP